jgi:predicted nucleic acid-binding protein
VIVVDTSVWIDVLNDTSAPQAERCVQLLKSGEPIALTDVILTEVLQGLRSDREVALVERQLRAFPILRLEDLDDFVLAASLYRTARRAGVTIRKTLDCLIAGPCVPVPRCCTPTRTSTGSPPAHRFKSGKADGVAATQR